MMKAEISRIQSLPDVKDREENRKLKSQIEFLEKKIDYQNKEKLALDYELVKNQNQILKNKNDIYLKRINELERIVIDSTSMSRKISSLENKVSSLERENNELRKNGGYTDYELQTESVKEKIDIKFRNKIKDTMQEDENTPVYSSIVKYLLTGEHFKFGTTFTYVIKGLSDSVFKIGKSKNPFKRVTNLADERGEALCIYAISPFDVENDVHDYYRKFRVRTSYEKSSEWFNLGQNPMNTLEKDSEKNGWGFIVLPQPISTTRNGTK